MAIVGHIFAYGSLVAAPGVIRATLRGHRRVWGVAMDNRVAIPGYKVYALPDGERPAAAVAFLDLAPAPDGAPGVNGGLLAVDADALRALEHRERQYRLLEVTAAVDVPPPDGRPVWAFVGRDKGRARAASGHAGSAPVLIQRAYVDLVAAAFGALGGTAPADFGASTEPPPFPVVELTRIDLPLCHRPSRRARALD